MHRLIMFSLQIMFSLIIFSCGKNVDLNRSTFDNLIEDTSSSDDSVGSTADDKSVKEEPRVVESEVASEKPDESSVIEEEKDSSSKITKPLKVVDINSPIKLASLVTNIDDLTAKDKETLKFEKGTGEFKNFLKISTNSPLNHTFNLKMSTSRKYQVDGFYLDVGIYSLWKFIGSKRSDTLYFGPQGVIINKKVGGVVDFGVDSEKDTFVFTNTINVARCSEKHGFTCHPLNHLNNVTINNFGREDLIVLQGKRYRYDDVKNGLLPGVPAERLKVNIIK